MMKEQNLEYGDRTWLVKSVVCLFLCFFSVLNPSYLFGQNALPTDSLNLIDASFARPNVEIPSEKDSIAIDKAEDSITTDSLNINNGDSLPNSGVQTPLENEQNTIDKTDTSLASNSLNTSDASISGSDVQVSFVKDSARIGASELYFNAVKITNNTTLPLTGIVTFTAPEGWMLLTASKVETSIAPNDNAWIPIRLTPDPNATGGLTYLLAASFRTKEKFSTTNTYITIPSQVKWEIVPVQSSLFFTENKPEDNIQVRLINRGNTNELIRVQYKIGKLLAFTNNNFLSEMINLPAYKDTILTRTITSENQLPVTERIRYEGLWRESTVTVNATTETDQQTIEVQTRRLNSTFINRRDQSASPLNFSFQMYNLLASQEPRSSFNTYGNILFTKNRQVDYMVGLQNFFYSQKGNQNFDINRQLIYNIRYSDSRNRIHIGYNMNGGSLHNLSGRGLTGNFRINNQNAINYGFTQNPYNQTIGQFIGYSTSIKSISLLSELTHENNSSSNYAASSVLLGTGFRLFKNHTLGFHVMGSQSEYKTLAGRDTALLGLSFRAQYYVKYKDFEFRVSALNSRYNYIRNAGREQYNVNSKLKVSDNTRIAFYGNRQYYSTTRYPYNFDNPANFNSNDFARMTAIISGRKVTYQIGPTYTGYMRKTHNLSNSFSSIYSMNQPGIWSGATFKINNYSSVTPNLTISNMRFSFKSDNPLTPSRSSTDNLYYSLGANYYDGIWMLNLNYTNGSTSDLYRNILVNENALVTKSVQIRPSYQNYFFNKKVKLTASMIYAYYIPSGRENTTLNIKYDQFLKNGWSFYINSFVNSNTRIIKDQGRINSKDLNIVAGVVKEFNLQQPRLKYYNLRTVIFNELTGDRMKSDNEPPLSNILVNITKMRSDSMTRSNMAEIELVTDVNGEIVVENLPQSNYRLRFSPLANLQSLYFLNGAEQSYYSNKDQVIYVPLTESNRIKGKVSVVRDPNSSEGRIELGNVRVEAKGKNGEVYSTLTDNLGSYILSVPAANGSGYTVKVNNVFGPQFTIDADEITIHFGNNKAINIDFTFTEKKREIIFTNE